MEIHSDSVNTFWKVYMKQLVKIMNSRIDAINSRCSELHSYYSYGGFRVENSKPTGSD